MVDLLKFRTNKKIFNGVVALVYNKINAKFRPKFSLLDLKKI